MQALQVICFASSDVGRPSAVQASVCSSRRSAHVLAKSSQLDGVSFDGNNDACHGNHGQHLRRDVRAGLLIASGRKNSELVVREWPCSGAWLLNLRDMGVGGSDSEMPEGAGSSGAISCKRGSVCELSGSVCHEARWPRLVDSRLDLPVRQLSLCRSSTLTAADMRWSVSQPCACPVAPATWPLKPACACLPWACLGRRECSQRDAGLPWRQVLKAPAHSPLRGCPQPMRCHLHGAVSSGAGCDGIKCIARPDWRVMGHADHQQQGPIYALNEGALVIKQCP